MDPVLRQALQEGEAMGTRYALQIPQSSMAGTAGTRLGRRTGTSIDFQDYREYQPGDDLRFIDWAAYGRTDRLTVKLFREEVTPHLDLIIDGSRSMRLEASGKAEAAATLGALLAMSASNARCSRAVWLSARGFRRLQEDVHPPSMWEGLEFESTLPMDQSFEMLAPRLRRAGMRILVSDLLWPAPPNTVLRRLSDGGAALTVIQLLAAADVEPPEHGSIRLQDSETGEAIEIYVDAAVAGRYRESLAAHQQLWNDACRQCGARMITVIAGRMDEGLRALQEIQALSPA